MGRLTIERVIYNGKYYYFESPKFNDGLNIILGSNGTGKTTFVNFIYYALGGDVPEFRKDSKSEKEKHKEICSDEDNYVELVIKIDLKTFNICRYISKNYITVTDVEKQINDNYRVKRKGNGRNFSDWILKKLNISIFDLYVGNKKWGINFNDIMRLIYYDQSTPIAKIYKDIDNSARFIDSILARKMVFEVLLGKIYDEYYNFQAELKSKEREKELKKEALKMFQEFKKEITGKEDIVNTIELNRIRDKLILKLEELKISRQNIKEANSTPNDIFIEIEEKRRFILELDNKIRNVVNQIKKYETDCYNILYLQKRCKVEIEQLKKVRYVHNRLNLFSPNTCPYCLKEVKRTKGKCICGSSIEEDDYEKFFYTNDEYLDIILSKEKSLKSYDDTLNERNKVIQNLKEELSTLEINREKIGNIIKNMSKEIYSNYNSEKVKELDDNILYSKEYLSEVEQLIKLEEKREILVEELDILEKEFKKLQRKNDKLELKVQEDISEKINLFSTIYEKYMKIVDKNCFTAEINENYMPFINNGVYIGSSAKVHIRLMYFITLLEIAIQDNNTNHPKFLLIDTPDKEGIDKQNLIHSLKQIETLLELGKDKFQIILTSGYDKYPENLDECVVLKLNDENKLLVKREEKIIAIKLTKKEMEILFQQDPSKKGRGGYQKLFVSLQEKTNKETGIIKLTDSDIEKISRYALGYKTGGYQYKLKSIFKRTLGDYF